MNYITLCVYNLILVGGTAYLVQAHDWSPWWFALCLVFGASFKNKNKDKS
jgi:hypothetical protein